MRKQIFLLALVSILVMPSLFAQEKYGYLNLGNVLVEMSETQAADKDITQFQETLVAAFEEKAKAFQVKVEAFYQEVQGGTLAPVQQAEKEKALQDEQNSLRTEEQEIANKLENRRRELMGPILEKVQAAVEKVAKDNGYVMIFDTSSFNAILFVEESSDVTPLVKVALGIE